MLFSKFPSRRMEIISNHTFGKSFKIPQKFINCKWIVLRYFYSLIKLPVINLNNNISTKNLIFDSKKKSKQSRLSFVNYYVKKNNFEFISYEELLFFNNYFLKLIYLSVSVPFVIFIFITSLFFDNKSSFALMLEYPLVLGNLFRKIQNCHDLNIFYFSIYERESNFIAYFLKRNNIHVTKIASDTPLSFWNQNILSDSLILCNYYQFSELDKFKETIDLKNVTLWGPEMSPIYKHLYYDNIKTTAYTIGFYSTASWLRKQLGHVDQKDDSIRMEEIVLSCIKQLIIDNPDLIFYIFLHPKEKNSKIFTQVKTHYNNILGKNITFKFAENKKSSAELFDLVDLGIAFNTTIIHERIYCGFKTIIFPNNPNFPIKSSSLSNICSYNETQLINKAQESLKISTEEFFFQNNLIPYTFRNYKI